jgi:hypothetical protein
MNEQDSTYCELNSTYSVAVHERLFVNLDSAVRALALNLLRARDATVTRAAGLGLFSEMCQRTK